MPGVRLRTLADVVAYAQAEGVELRVDGTETQVRRPRANRCGRRAFVSGKKRRTPSRSPPSATARGGRCGPGRCAQVGCTAGYRGLAKAFGGQVHAPPPKPAKAASPEELAAWQRARTQQSSQRICVEHANAEHKQWRALQRWIGRREHYAETHLAIAGLVSDRAARR